MRPILTLTANVLAETTYTLDGWIEGETQRAREEQFQVGGKGINVTRMLRRLGADSTALWFPGGASGARCAAWLRGRGIPEQGFATPDETRTGAVVRAAGRAETTFLGRDCVVTPDAVVACIRFLESMPDAPLAVCGSVPGWGGAAWAPLREALAARCARAWVSLDTYGPALAALTALPVALVKINRREFAGLLALAPGELDDARLPEALARCAADLPPLRWVVTGGPRPLWSCERGGTARRIEVPPVREVSPTGSGDVLHAGLLHAMLNRGATFEAALHWALPLAAANAAHPGVAEFALPG